MAIVTSEACELATVQDKLRANNMVASNGRLTVDDIELIKQLCLPSKIVSQNLSVGGIRMRTFRLAGKLGVENRASIIVKALKLGLVSLDELTYREF
uniref:Uncharacterized protein n=1 Tax=viral metagenome TaxID=1070528 RepID=A0A6H1Z7Q7_9ZZZZ